MGEDGSESVISSISSWDWDLVFFLLNACLKELRNCKTDDRETLRRQYGHPPTSKFQIRKALVLCRFPSNGHCLVTVKREAKSKAR